MLFIQNANYIRNEDLSIVYSSESGKDEGTRMSMFRKGLIFAASITVIYELSFDIRIHRGHQGVKGQL